MALDLQSARYTVNPLLSPPGDLSISSTFEMEGLFARGGGGVFNLAKAMVSVLHRQLE